MQSLKVRNPISTKVRYKHHSTYLWGKTNYVYVPYDSLATCTAAKHRILMKFSIV